MYFAIVYMHELGHSRKNTGAKDLSRPQPLLYGKASGTRDKVLSPLNLSSPPFWQGRLLPVLSWSEEWGLTGLRSKEITCNAILWKWSLWYSRASRDDTVTIRVVKTFLRGSRATGCHTAQRQKWRAWRSFRREPQAWLKGQKIKTTLRKRLKELSSFCLEKTSLRGNWIIVYKHTWPGVQLFFPMDGGEERIVDSCRWQIWHGNFKTLCIILKDHDMLQLPLFFFFYAMNFNHKYVKGIREQVCHRLPNHPT